LDLKIHLRALEKSDLTWLYLIENDQSLWKYSNTILPYSFDLLKDYIKNSRRDIFDVKQLRMVISLEDKKGVGLVDLFDFRPEHKRAGIGVIVDKEFHNKGIAKKALQLLEIWAKEKLQLHQLYTYIAEENLKSINLFKSLGYIEIGLKNDWNFYEGKYNNEYTFQKILNE